MPVTRMPLLPSRRTPRLPAAGCSAIKDLVTAPARTAKVLSVSSTAVYLHVSGVPERAVVALVASDGVRLPNSLVLGVPSAEQPFAGVTAGERAVVGEGRVRVGQLLVEATRWRTPARVRPARSLDNLERGLSRLVTRLGAPEAASTTPDSGGTHGLDLAVAELAEATAGLQLERALTAVEELIGRGPGLTPTGDDMLGAFLVTVDQLTPDEVRELREFGGVLGWIVAKLAARNTTALSGALLDHAVRGEAPEEVTDVLAALAGRSRMSRALPRLLAVSQCSGYAMARGIEAGADVIARYLQTVRAQSA